MKKSYIHMHPRDFKERYSNHFQHKKKVKALENLNSVQEFEAKHSFSLTTIKSFLSDGFLENEEEKFLDWLLSKYEVDYLEWAHRTKWLQERMEAISHKNSLAKQRKEQEAKKESSEKQMCMDFSYSFEKKDPVSNINIPFHLLKNQNKMSSKRV